MTVRSLLLGIDASPRRLGWGLVDLVTGEPVACGCEQLWADRDTVDWEQQRSRFASALDVVRLAEKVPLDSGPPREVQAIYVEYPISRFPRASFDNGRALGFVQSDVQRRWPHAPWQELRPSEWRLLAGLKGNATKEDVTVAAGITVANYPDTPMLEAVVNAQDAADALLIAIAGQRRNAENWQRGAA